MSRARNININVNIVRSEKITLSEVAVLI